jgi:hypothetical protein
MVRNTSLQGLNPRADVQLSQWDDADWDHEHDEAAIASPYSANGSPGNVG